MPISESKLTEHLATLCRDIGVRLSGSPSEKAAAEYVAEQFQHAGHDLRVEIEEFPMRERAVSQESLEIQLDGRWQTFPGSLFSNTPGTEGQTVEAPLVLFEAPAVTCDDDLSHLTGKAVVHLGCHIESRAAYRRLIEAKPAFLLMVDVRYPGEVPLADGMFPSYTSDLGAVPTVNVAYQDAWRWKVEGATAARCCVHGGMSDSVSQNVIATLPGADPDAGALYLGAHHDTQAGSVGADDNATGVAGLCELARLLASLPRKRTIRLISFGCEEQLSVGSATYVRRHWDRLRQEGRFLFNLDSYGSHMGWNELNCNGPDSLAEYLRAAFKRQDQLVHISPKAHPYADHFPFVAAGVPAVTLIRCNCTSGRFFHHRPDDDLGRVSTRVMASLLTVVADCTADLATRDELPFPVEIPADQEQAVNTFWVDLFGGGP